MATERDMRAQCRVAVDKVQAQVTGWLDAAGIAWTERDNGDSWRRVGVGDGVQIDINADAGPGWMFRWNPGGTIAVLVKSYGGTRRWTKPTAEKVVAAVREHKAASVARHDRYRREREAGEAAALRAVALSNVHPELVGHIHVRDSAIQFAAAASIAHDAADLDATAARWAEAVRVLRGES